MALTELDLREQRTIENWWHAKAPVREIARVLRRHKSTIFREIKRNFWADDALPKKYAEYFGHASQLQTNKRMKPVMGKIIKAVHDLPHIARRSITFDRGTAFVSWPHLQAKMGTQTWFCDPSSPWQKGTMENTNRRARRWLPRKRDITAVSTSRDIASQYPAGQWIMN